MNPFQQPPPPTSDKIPIQAQMILMQPQAVNMLKQMNGLDLVSLFYFQMPFMLPQKDLTAIQKNAQKFLSLAGIGFLVGLVANVQVKRINMNFLKLPFYVRLPIRLGIMALPFAALYPTLNQKGNQIMTIINNITLRKNKLLRTKDLEQYFQIQKPQPQLKGKVGKNK